MNPTATTPAPAKQARPAKTYPAPLVRVQLVRERALEAPRIRDPRDVAALVSHLLDGDDRENFVALLLDARNQVRAIVPVSVGDISSTIAHPRETFRAAVLMGASSLIVAHNHPSGDPTPGPEDLGETRRLFEAGRLLGIELLDHIIVGEEGRFVSLKEQGAF